MFYIAFGVIDILHWIKLDKNLSVNPYFLNTPKIDYLPTLVAVQYSYFEPSNFLTQFLLNQNRWIVLQVDIQWTVKYNLSFYLVILTVL